MYEEAGARGNRKEWCRRKDKKLSRNNGCMRRQEQKGVGIGSEGQSGTASWSSNRGCMRKQEQEGVESVS